MNKDNTIAQIYVTNFGISQCNVLFQAIEEWSFEIEIENLMIPNEFRFQFFFIYTIFFAMTAELILQSNGNNDLWILLIKLIQFSEFLRW